MPRVPRYLEVVNGICPGGAECREESHRMLARCELNARGDSGPLEAPTEKVIAVRPGSYGTTRYNGASG